MKAVLASGNPHKARELAEALPRWGIEPLGVALPEEVGDTLYENARAKAAFARALAPPDAWVLGEDTGLEVAALGGAPGVRSARFAGDGASAADNVAKLLSELAGVVPEARVARFVTELVALAPDGEEVRATGALEGAIATEPRGTAGFGYDPVFVPAGEERTVAELGPSWKREHSHRARAANALREAVGTQVESL